MILSNSYNDRMNTALQRYDFAVCVCSKWISVIHRFPIGVSRTGSEITVCAFCFNSRVGAEITVCALCINSRIGAEITGCARCIDAHIESEIAGCALCIDDAHIEAERTACARYVKRTDTLIPTNEISNSNKQL